MDFKDCLKDEMKRLNRMNDLLEKKMIKDESINICAQEAVLKNASAMCEIAKALKFNCQEVG